MAAINMEIQVDTGKSAQENCVSRSLFLKEQNGHRQLPWKAEEDRIIMSFYDRSGSCLKLPWVQMAKEINQIIHNGVSVRNFHNCRERFLNHLNPSLVKGNWKQEEDYLIFRKKSKNFLWSQIQKLMPTRNVHQIKNRYYWTVQQYLQKNQYCVELINQVVGIKSVEEFYSQYGQSNDKQILSLLKKYKSNHQFNQVVQSLQQLSEQKIELPTIQETRVASNPMIQVIDKTPNQEIQLQVNNQPVQSLVQQNQNEQSWLYYGVMNPQTQLQPIYQQYNGYNNVNCWSAVQECTVDYRNVFLPYQ